MLNLRFQDEITPGTKEALDASERHRETPLAEHGNDAAHTRCVSCLMRNICMAAGLDARELARMNSVVQSGRMVRQGERLYRAGDQFRCLYAIRTGSFKTVVLPERGKEYIAGFYMAGDALGMEGICHEAYRCDAVALEDSAVCVIPFQLLEALCREVVPLQRGLHKMFSAEIVRESHQMLLLGSLSAEQRVAAFLLGLSERYRERGYSATSFVLRMTREDIGSFLGLTLETVSRTLSRFQQESLISVRGKSIQLLDPEALAARQGEVQHGSAPRRLSPRAGSARLVSGCIGR